MKPWERAVRAETPALAPKDIGEAVRDELANLWGDLDQAIRDACDGTWSAGCESLTMRITRLSRIAGATPWEQVRYGLLMSGIYQDILTAAGVDFAPPDMDEVRELEAYCRTGRIPVFTPPGPRGDPAP